MAKLDCGHAESDHLSCTVGYGRTPAGHRICYDCCAVDLRLEMLREGKGVLYLNQAYEGWTLTDWSGRLSLVVQRHKLSHHNIARIRYDVWFNFSDGHTWHGVQIGSDTQICRVKRTKSKWKV